MRKCEEEALFRAVRAIIRSQLGCKNKEELKKSDKDLSDILEDWNKPEFPLLSVVQMRMMILHFGSQRCASSAL